MNKKSFILTVLFVSFFAAVPLITNSPFNVYAKNKKINVIVKAVKKSEKKHKINHKDRPVTWKRHLKKQEDFSYTVKEQMLSAKIRRNWRKINITEESFINLNDVKKDGNKKSEEKHTKKEESIQKIKEEIKHKENQGPDVEVGIISGNSEVKVEGNASFKVIADGKLIKENPEGTTLVFSRDNNKVKINGKTAGSIIYLESNSEAPFSVKGNRYRGVMKIIPARWNSGLTVINILPMELYLRGVVPREIIPSWKSDAIKAQAVAARTYAIFHKNGYRSAGYDVTDDTRSQMYGGYSSETKATDKAIKETSGEIITYNGSPIDAVFSANAGGYTENSENVWGSKVYYLRAVPEVSYSVIDEPWVKEMSLNKFRENLVQRGIDVGEIKNIKLSKLKKGPMKTGDRGVSGRVKYIDVVGKKGIKRITGEKLQVIFDLDSTLFDFNIKNKGKNIEIIGYGNGHGLGLSQWGAQAMAEKYGDGKNYYKRILSHYFTDTKIEKIY